MSLTVFYQQVAWNFMGFSQLLLQHQILAVSLNLQETQCSSPPPPRWKAVAASSPSRLEAPGSSLSSCPTLRHQDSFLRVPFSLLMGFPSPSGALCRSLGKSGNRMEIPDVPASQESHALVPEHPQALHVWFSLVFLQLVAAPLISGCSAKNDSDYGSLLP